MPSENGPSAKDAYLKELDSQIERLVTLRALVAAGGDTSAAEVANAGPLARRAPTETEVHPGSFLGMSVPQATRRFLEIMGKSRPQAPTAIAAALVLGNQDKPENEATVLRNVYTAFKRGKDREGGFKKVGRFWGLAEWYPSSAIGHDSSSGKKNSKGRKKKRKAAAASTGKPSEPAAAKQTWRPFLAEAMRAGKTMQQASEEWKARQSK